MISKWREAEDLIRDFKTKFIQQFDAWIDIEYDFNRAPDLPKISLGELLDIVNEIVEEEFHGTVKTQSNEEIVLTHGVLTKTRAFELIIYRHIFFYTAVRLGYRLMQIEKFLPIPYDHTTILHGKKKMIVALEIRDKHVLRAYNKVCEKIHEVYSINVANERQDGDTE